MPIIVDRDVKPHIVAEDVYSQEETELESGVEETELASRMGLGEYIANVICGLDILLKRGGIVVGKVGDTENMGTESRDTGNRDTASRDTESEEENLA